MSENGKAKTIPAPELIAFPPALMQQLMPLYQAKAQIDQQIGQAVKAWAIGKELDTVTQNLLVAPDGKGVTLQPIEG